MMLVLALAILLVTASTCTDSVTGDYKNIQHLHNLCLLVALKQITTLPGDVSEISPAETEELEKINISLASPEWKAGFATQTQDKKQSKPECTAPGDKPQCSQKYAKWEDLWVQVHATQDSKKEYLLPKSKLMSPEGRATAVSVQALPVEAEAIRTTYNSNRQAALGNQEGTPQQLIHEAIFGAAKQADLTKTDCAITLTATRGSDCGGKPGKQALCGTLVCLCAQDSTQNKELCGTTASPNTPTGWNDAQKSTMWQPILSVCDKYPAPRPSPEQIHQLISTALAAAERKNTGGDHVTLGEAPASGSCASAEGQGCIQLTDTGSTTASAPTGKLAWKEKLEKAADEIKIHENVAARREAAIQRIQQLTKHAKHLITALQNSFPDAATQTISTQKTQPKQHSPEIAEECHKHDNKNATCPREKCTYDTKTNKCNPIKTAEAAATPGTGEETTKEKCKGKPQGECKSPDCK
uniref:Variant surface glycoprotein 1125.1160 n=1 Tax=Trypanosoma brucei TaxID=5691 RepID=A0A1J0R6D5_9TRYP|nr:variant surface glycoprotein 1125.1160 [Trypanosoma brucei]